MRVGDHDILALTERQLAKMRGSVVSMIFQEPMTALDPVYTIGHQIAETVVRHEGVSWRAALDRALELLQLVKVPSPERRLQFLSARAFGRAAAARDDRHRAVLPSRAVACRRADDGARRDGADPGLVLLRKLQREFGMGLIFVTHDLGVAAQIADQVAVMYAGRIVEYGSARDVLMSPRHPYTIGMLASTVHGEMRGKDIEAIPGSPPDLRALPPGCSFAARCKFAVPDCILSVPPVGFVAPGHSACCFRLDEIHAPGASRAQP